MTTFIFPPLKAKARNTLARSNELKMIAAEIAARENINPAFPPDDKSYIYIMEISVRGRCHPETARKVWKRWLQTAGKPSNWGGKRVNAGRKPSKN